MEGFFLKSTVLVTAFIDWRSQMHIVGADRKTDAVEQAHLTLASTTRVLGKALMHIDKNFRYKVQLRLYHGWTKGYTHTVNRSAIASVVASADFASLSMSPDVVIDQNVGYGDLLLSALPKRLVGGVRHLPGTLRRDGERQGEKMVDTALAADLLETARRTPDEWSVVFAEDDDLVPPIFVAESWKSRGSGRVILIRKRTLGAQNYLNLDGILLRDTWR